MTTLFYCHPNFLLHDTGTGHPESAERIRAISAALDGSAFSALTRVEAPKANLEQIRLIHPDAYVQRILKSIPTHGYAHADGGDTVLSPGSGEAALHAAGAACAAVDEILAGRANNAFCAVRPPGHHAEPSRAMGFCLFNNVAIAAAYARSSQRVRRLAIVDFDVHHGNGTQAAFFHEPDVLYASTHQSPLFPGTGQSHEIGVGNIVNVPLPPGSGSEQFQEAVRQRILTALHVFKPELLLISAGFDAHRNDPLASLLLTEKDYAWITLELIKIADLYCRGRVISVLEGGYNLEALAASSAAHVSALLSA